MQIDRHVERFGGLPERIVVIARERNILRRHLPDEAADEARLLAALQFLDRVLEIIKRDRGNAEEAPGRDFAVVDQPVVGELEAGFLYFRVFEREEPEPERRIQNFRRDAVDGHLVEARLRVPAAGLLTRRIARRELGIFRLERRRQVFLEEIDRLHDVRIGRNQNLVRQDRRRFLSRDGDAHEVTPLRSALMPRSDSISYYLYYQRLDRFKPAVYDGKNGRKKL